MSDLAKVGDLIEHGQDIPANVKVFTDRDSDRWVRTAPDRFTQIDDPKDDADGAGGGFKQEAMQRSPRWWPFTVVEVDPEPQPAERHCYTSAAHDPHTWVYAPGTDARTVYACDGHRPQPAERKLIGPPHAHQDAPCTDACYEPAARQPGEVLPPVRSQELAVQYLDEEPGGTASDTEMLEVLKERDDAIEWADRLAQAVAEFLHIDIGEHSNANLPWQAALIALTDTVSPQPAESGPLVLTLPQPPEGTVALVGALTKARYTPLSGRWWSPNGIGWKYSELLGHEGSVTVEMAPPREPRTWPKLTDQSDDDLPDSVQLTGVPDRTEIWRRYSPDGVLYVDGQSGMTLAELRTLGDVREVIEP